MADTKISALTALTGANVDTAADVLAIVDTDVTTTKKILIDELRIALGIATQANQETATSLVTTVTPGRQQYHPSAAKAWCQATTSGGSDGAYNITSITDAGVGDVYYNLTTALTGATPSAAFVVGTKSDPSYLNSVANSTTTGSLIRHLVRSTTGTLTDPNYFHMIAFGDFA